jgi:expansin
MQHSTKHPRLSRAFAAGMAALIALATFGSLQAAGGTVFFPIATKIDRPVAPVLPLDPYAARSGQATFYDADGSGNCSFPATPGNLMVAAMNAADYAGSLTCGAFVKVTGPRSTITVRIVDQCPECPRGNIDLSAAAFALIAGPIEGRVPITWRLVSPALDGPIIYHFKEGSSQWWTAVQIRNHRNPIWRVEYRAASGAWKALPRASYNYFMEAAGMGPGPYAFRVTDFYGNTLVDTGIPLLVDGDALGKGQFPTQL